MNEPIFITGADGHRRALGINDPAPVQGPPAPIPTWDWTPFTVWSSAGWRPLYGGVRAAWGVEDERGVEQLVYTVRVHPEDVTGWKAYADRDRDVIRYEEQF